MAQLGIAAENMPCGGRGLKLSSPVLPICLYNVDAIMVLSLFQQSVQNEPGSPLVLKSPWSTMILL